MRSEEQGRERVRKEKCNQRVVFEKWRRHRRPHPRRTVEHALQGGALRGALVLRPVVGVVPQGAVDVALHGRAVPARAEGEGCPSVEPCLSVSRSLTPACASEAPRRGTERSFPDMRAWGDARRRCARACGARGPSPCTFARRFSARCPPRGAAATLWRGSKGGTLRLTRGLRQRGFAEWREEGRYPVGRGEEWPCQTAALTSSFTRPLTAAIFRRNLTSTCAREGKAQLPARNCQFHPGGSQDANTAPPPPSPGPAAESPRLFVSSPCPCY